MRKLLFIFLFPIQLVYGQNNISLDSCYAWARENYPNLRQGELWKEISMLNLENIKTSYLPKLTLNAQATYQSDVVKINIPLPGVTIPTVANDQYKAYAEFRQTIWDGGISNISRQLENAILQNHLNVLEIEVYKLNEQVLQAFFTALVVEKQKDVIAAQKTVLNEKLKTIQSGIRNGVVEKSAALIIQAEILNLEQKEIELAAGKNTAVQMLSILTGRPDLNNAKFVFETPDNSFNASLNRPELQLFSSQTNQLETQIQLLDKTRNPKLFGFGQAGYGKPGLNMLNDSFDTYYLVGVGVSWNAFDWKNNDRQKRVLRFQQEMIQEQEATFSQNIQLLLVRQKEQITKLENMLTNDEQMVLLRNEIAKSSASKLENETITASDYIQDVQAETVSKLNFELHKIQLNEATEKYNLIKGK